MSKSKLTNIAAGAGVVAGAASIGATAGAAVNITMDALTDDSAATDPTDTIDPIDPDNPDNPDVVIIDNDNPDELPVVPAIEDDDIIECVYAGPEYFGYGSDTIYNVDDDIVIDTIEDVYGGPVSGWGNDDPEEMIDPDLMSGDFLP